MGNVNNLKSLVASVLRPNPPYHATKEFVNLCHKIAVAYLRVKSASRRFSYDKFALSSDDIAYDAIAELFRRDEKGVFTSLVAYFERDGLAVARSNEEIFSDVRRLVLSAVNNRLFRLYRASDPSLAKLIRNMKLTLKSHPLLVVETITGEQVIALRAKNDRGRHRPVIPPELLLPELFERSVSRSRLRDVLNALAETLREQTQYRHQIPLVEAAVVIRSFYLSGLEMAANTTSDTPLLHGEIEAFARWVVVRLKGGTGASYLRKKKLTRGQLASHLAAVREILIREFDGTATGDCSYFGVLKSHYNALTDRQYRAKHRVILEYFAKAAKADMRELLRKELRIP